MRSFKILLGAMLLLAPSVALAEPYIRVTAGAHFDEPTVYDYARTSAQPNPVTGKVGKFTSRAIMEKSGLAIEGAIGEDFGAFRLELQAGYLRQKGKNQGCSSCSFYSPEALDGANHVVTGMGNALVDLPIGPVTLSAGGGLGVAAILPGTQYPDGTWKQRNGSLVFAYQGIGEARVRLTRRLDLGVRYAYLQTGPATYEFRSQQGRTVSQNRQRFHSQQVTAGLTYRFGK